MMFVPGKELSSDLEAQKIGLLHNSDDLKTTGTREKVVELFEKPTSTLTPPGDMIKTTHRSNQTSFLIWTTINTLATIGIVKNPFHCI